jgi:hypothetical protein
MSNFSNVGGVPNTKTFYDKMVYEPLHFKKAKGGDHDVGMNVEAIIPSAEEVRLIGNRHKQCTYT